MTLVLVSEWLNFAPAFVRLKYCTVEEVEDVDFDM